MPAQDNSLPDWRRAHGDPVFQGLIRQTPSDFQVSEELGFPLSDDGEHDFLWIEKEGANTSWAARQLAEHAGVAERDVGYAGRKDRHAITRQWFSVRRPTGEGTNWRTFDLPDVRILEIRRNLRKLKRGANSGNRFRIAIRAGNIVESDVAVRLELIRDHGVPNYFGEQRFGRGGGNIRLASDLFAGKRMKRDKRSIALSAARSLLFNQILDARIADNSWNRAAPGEALNLDGSGSIFIADEIDAELRQRIDTLDVHPTGAMWGRGKTQGYGQAEIVDRQVVARYPEFAAGLEKIGVEMSRRALRLAVKNLTFEILGDTLWLEFSLGRGSYATAVLREIVT